jgi:hypothetical protein
MTGTIELVIAVLAIVFLWLFLSRKLRPRSPAEPIDQTPVLAGLKPRRPKGSGAVALEEPDEDTHTDAYSRK